MNLFALPTVRFDANTTRQIPEIAYLVDGQNRTIDQIADLDDTAFSVRPSLNLGFEKQPVWIRFEIHNSGRESQFIVEIAQPLLHFVDFYAPNAQRGFTRFTAGRLAAARTSLKHHKILFPLTVSANSAGVAYVRVATKDTLLVPVTIWRANEFALQERYSNIAFGAFYGIITIIFIYNFFLLLSLREKTYIFYLAYLVFFALFRLSVDGNIYPALMPTNAWLNWRLPLLTVTGVFTTLIFFSDAFMNVREKNPRLSLALRSLALLLPLSLPFCFFESGMLIATQLVNVISGIGVLLTIIASILGLLQRNRQAQFYVLAEAALLVAILVTVLGNFGHLPVNALTLNIVPASFLLELSLLSIGLADKMTRLKSENAAMALKAEKSELERTRLELEAIKSVISPHSLLNSIQAISSDMKSNPTRAREILADLGTEFRSVIGWASKSEILLADEIALCQAHLRIMNRRTGHKYTLKVPKKIPEMPIPPLIIHTLIENAISHEAESSRGLTIDLATLPTPEKGLLFTCKGKVAGNHTGAGVGTKYIRARLELAFGTAYAIHESFAANSWQVKINFHA